MIAKSIRIIEVEVFERKHSEDNKSDNDWEIEDVSLGVMTLDIVVEIANGTWEESKNSAIARYKKLNEKEISMLDESDIYTKVVFDIEYDRCHAIRTIITRDGKMLYEKFLPRNSTTIVYLLHDIKYKMDFKQSLVDKLNSNIYNLSYNIFNTYSAVENFISIFDII